MSGNSAQRHSAASSLPRGTGGGETDYLGRESGIDIFPTNKNNPKPVDLDTSKPHVIFSPK